MDWLGVNCAGRWGDIGGGESLGAWSRRMQLPYGLSSPCLSASWPHQELSSFPPLGPSPVVCCLILGPEQWSGISMNLWTHEPQINFSSSKVFLLGVLIMATKKATFNFLRDFHVFFTMAAPIYIPSKSVQWFTFFHTFPNTHYLSVLGNSHPNRYEVTTDSTFDLYFLVSCCNLHGH